MRPIAFAGTCQAAHKIVEIENTVQIVRIRDLETAVDIFITITLVVKRSFFCSAIIAKVQFYDFRNHIGQIDAAIELLVFDILKISLVVEVVLLSEIGRSSGIAIKKGIVIIKRNPFSVGFMGEDVVVADTVFENPRFIESMFTGQLVYKY